MITIIVLLILAGVTISTLTGQNGILTQAQEANKTTSDAEIYEQIKLAYGAYIIAYSQNPEIDVNEEIKKYLEDFYGKDKENVQKVSFSSKSGKLKVKINGVDYQYNIKKNTIGTYKDPINYGSKTSSTISKNDRITINEEQFNVLYNNETKIVAIPIHNLKLNETPIKQAKSDTPQSEKISSFANQGAKYWNNGEQNIDMTYKPQGTNEYGNNIQKYIDAYKETLIEIMGADTIEEVRIGRQNELNTYSANGANVIPDNDTYWVGSASRMFANSVCYRNFAGLFDMGYDSQGGVRPIIIINNE